MGWGPFDLMGQVLWPSSRGSKGQKGGKGEEKTAIFNSGSLLKEVYGKPKDLIRHDYEILFSCI